MFVDRFIFHSVHCPNRLLFSCQIAENNESRRREAWACKSRILCIILLFYCRVSACQLVCLTMQNKCFCWIFRASVWLITLKLISVCLRNQHLQYIYAAVDVQNYMLISGVARPKFKMRQIPLSVTFPFPFFPLSIFSFSSLSFFVPFLRSRPP